MKKTKTIFQKVMEIVGNITSDHVGAYAAQSAYFFILCIIPIILLLLTLVQYTPVTKADVMTAVLQVFPTSVESLIASIVNQVYNQSTTVIPITILVALWSAGKGVLAMTSGLNCVYKCRETRNYLVLRIRATGYTVMFIIMIILMLVLSVFGNTLNIFIAVHIPFLKKIADGLIRIRSILTPAVMIFFLLMIYLFLPNRKGKLKYQLPGTVFATIGCMIVSWVFSVYLDVFTGFSSMYGSLTTIILIMLWLYFCMYCILIGGELNVMFGDKIFPAKQDNAKGSLVREDRDAGTKRRRKRK